MLFHVTMTHSVDECPGYNREKIPEFVSASEKMDEMAKQFNIKVHFMVNGLPEHVVFALLEADSPLTLAPFLASVPLKQDFKVTPVVHEHEVIELAKSMMGQG
ncbi:MAG: hypothetical protein IH860_05640 [Chloroflexi bacterium]|nr:hypothetical protein [Chloroflexota bacterium]